MVGAVGTCLHVSPLWTLQRSRFRTGPDVAAARADRGENHDPGGRRTTVLTEERRLENGPRFARIFALFQQIVGAAIYPALWRAATGLDEIRGSAPNYVGEHEAR